MDGAVAVGNRVEEGLNEWSELGEWYDLRDSVDDLNDSVDVLND
jgi:hypothetical protein